jgi:type I restriction enzyme S subunit
MANNVFTNPSAVPEVPSGWSVAAIEELCARVTSGATPLRTNAAYYEGGTIPWIRTQELNDGVIKGSAIKITRKALQETSAKLFPAGTVLMAMYGDGKTITSLGILGGEAATNQACCAMITDSAKCDYRFLFYALKHHREDFIHIATGGAQRNLSGALIRRFCIAVPPLDEQSSIAQILGSLDDKIELNRKMNETLEAMARALFKSWFVDFDPVRAKAEGRDTGLPAHIAALFPDSFEDSELGKIPRGWKAGSLSDFSSLNPESWSKATRPELIQYVDLSNTKWGRIESITDYEAESAPSRAQRVLRPGDTIVGTVRPGNGSYALITTDGLTGSTGFGVLRPLSTDYVEFVYLAATAPNNIDALAHLADGGAYPAVRPEAVISTQTAVPSDSVVSEFSTRVKPLLLRMAVAERENHVLAQTRDTLLPKLISGEVRLSWLEQQREGSFR